MPYKNKKDMYANNNKFISAAYDRINLTVPKGKKETIRVFAESKGESINRFINRAIDEAMTTPKDAE